VSLDAYFWLTIAGAVVSCFAAIGARALRDFSRHDLQEICQRRQDPDRFGDILRHHERVALGIEMVVVMAATMTVAGGSIWGYAWLTSAAPPSGWALLGSVVALGLVLAVSTVWLPWSIARIGAAKFLYHTWFFWWLVSRLTTPLVWTARVMDMLLHRMAGRTPQQQDEESFEEEIRTIVTEGHREGLLEEDAREMIEGVIELGDADVEHIMTPRTEMHMLQVTTAWEKMLDDVIASGHTRIPIYDKNRDDIIGILYIKDLLPELAKGPTGRRPLKEIVRKPLFVPETKAVDDLLQMFQQSRTHIAVVLDEYGGVSGLVTIEDVLEEIVGEIVDEYDKEVEEEITKIDDDVCEALGRAHVDQINEVMDFELPESEDFDTIGGFVFAEFGRVPMVGEHLTWQAGLRQQDQPRAAGERASRELTGRGTVRVTVLDATRRRINRVRLERIRQESLEIA
jgi:magnesium and cobalt exporter, CNNM family